MMDGKNIIDVTVENLPEDVQGEEKRLLEFR